jgi:hypothetical protein
VDLEVVFVRTVSCNFIQDIHFQAKPLDDAFAQPDPKCLGAETDAMIERTAFRTRVAADRVHMVLCAVCTRRAINRLKGESDSSANTENISNGVNAPRYSGVERSTRHRAAYGAMERALLSAQHDIEKARR